MKSLLILLLVALFGVTAFAQEREAAAQAAAPEFTGDVSGSILTHCICINACFVPLLRVHTKVQ